MIRVSKNNGQIIFGDESVAPWLRETEYGKMMTDNNNLWAADLPVDKFPLGVTSVKVTWILDNCFYLISCIKEANFPKTNLDVEHVGPRGGTIRTRYYGNLEGVTDDVKKLAIKKASSKNLSLSAFLTYLIKNS